MLHRLPQQAYLLQCSISENFAAIIPGGDPRGQRAVTYYVAKSIHYVDRRPGLTSPFMLRIRCNKPAQ
ncbi:hypothetical protein E4K66_21070 [Bradyrhizobium frederickii]|uniref:Uncharacterized protein n=1 Tax=Bradyrhizobium frederickii TaxID=2560054 RepID=A0A4Y9L3C2_9BRAD|nr:hypothetical protein [Bradyrhizobium frederickii]TFV37187.1 hypothetical protein E4K66_21070 [Bradyrhizobium frederickii]